ncbi:MAG: PH domain-containing protein [Candidatus Izemoplasmataceae bacterium]
MKRQHPIFIIKGLIDEIKSYIFPIVLFILFSFFGEDFVLIEDDWFLLVTLAFLFLGIVYAFLKWVFFKYQVTHEAIKIHSGVLIKKQRHIKKERIQTIHLESGLLYRAFKLTKLTIETAGNLNESEVSIEALPLDEAHWIKKTLTENKKPVELNQEEVNQDNLKTIKEIDMTTLFKAGFTSGSVGIVMALLFALIAQIIAFLPNGLETFFKDSYSRLGISLIIILFLVYVFIAWIISIIRYVIRYAFFTVTKENDDLMVERGLFVKKTLTLKLTRVQSIIITEGLLREPFNYASIEVEVAGGKTDKETELTIIHPLIKKHQIDDFLNEVFSDYQLTKTFTYAPKRARMRFLFRNLIPYVLLTPVFIFFPLSLWVMLFLPVSILIALSQHKHAGYHLNDDTLTLSKRVIAKKTIITKKKHIQALSFKATFLQRFKSLSTIMIHILAAPKAKSYQVVDLSVSDQEMIYTWLSKEV